MMQEDYFEQYMRKYYRDWKLDYTRYYPFYIRTALTEQLLQITHLVYRKSDKKKVIFDYRPVFKKEHDRIVNFAATDSICLDAALQVYRNEIDLSKMSRKEIRDFIDEHIQLCVQLKVDINLQAKLNLVKNL